MITIKNKAGKIIYQSETARDVKTAVEEAVRNRVSLERACLLFEDLTDAYLHNADLKGADLSYSNLRGTYLTNANLKYADLCGANLLSTDLCGANLSGVNIRSTNLSNANLSNANFKDVIYDESTSFFTIQCPSEGSFIGWKKARENITGNLVIVKLLITEDAKRSSATSKKCRCSKAKVLEIQNLDGTKNTHNGYIESMHDPLFHYKVGETVEVENFDEDRWNECSAGIHFFIDKGDAVNY